MSTSITTGQVRLSYEHLLKPYANQPGQEPKYSVTILVPKSDVATKAAIDAAIQAAITEGTASKWSGQRPAQPPHPIHDGDGVRPSGEAFGPECKGHWVFTASSKMQQEIVDLNLQRILDPTQIYSGIYARVSVNFFAYNQAGRKGIGAGLGPVQKLADGEPLGGRALSAEDAFGSAPAPAAPQYQQPAVPQYQTPVAAPQPYPQPAAPYQAPQPQYQPPAAPQYQQPAPAAPQYPPQPQYQPAPETNIYGI